jgi:hypothetical protein
MYKGDLSNEMPKRVLVNADILFIKSTTISKKYKFIPVKNVQVAYDKFLLNKFYVYTTRAAVTLELFSFEFDYEEMELLYNDIDRVGTNPFRYFSSYSSPKQLVADLPYRPEVIGVIDPEHQMMYGSLGLEI